MKYSFLLILLLSSLFIHSQTKVYLFPGQGSDFRMFSKLNLDSQYTFVHVIYPVPEKGTSLKQYAQSIGKQIDTASTFILIGVSLGGMICSELSETLKPKKTIIVSGAKCRSELPFRYRFQKYIPINKLVPKRLTKAGALFLQPIIEPDRNKEKATFTNMLKAKDAAYLKRTADMIINWDKKTFSKNIIHIHGSKDHTIPIRKVQTDHIINKGSHMMMLTRSQEINLLINLSIK